MSFTDQQREDAQKKTRVFVKGPRVDGKYLATFCGQRRVSKLVDAAKVAQLREQRDSYVVIGGKR